MVVVLIALVSHSQELLLCCSVSLMNVGSPELGVFFIDAASDGFFCLVVVFCYLE